MISPGISTGSVVTGEPPIEAERLVIIGATGSVGVQTLEVVAALKEQRAREGRSPIRIEALFARSSGAELIEQAKRFDVRTVGLSDSDSPCPDTSGIHCLRGRDEIAGWLREQRASPGYVLFAAAPGLASLPLVDAWSAGPVAVANKELLVAAGELLTARDLEVRPLDSEHAAALQAITGAGPTPRLPLNRYAPDAIGRIDRLTLTASGGPFREWSAERIDTATPNEALAHPVWSMGAKNTIDSANLTNKALEIIEAHWLFGVPADRIDAVVHPQSTVHALISFADGSQIAQLATPDMKLCIQQALLGGSDRPSPTPRLDLAQLGTLTFEAPDTARFPSLALAHEVMARGGSAGAVFNAVNEIAVEAFLQGAITFGAISRLQHAAMDHIETSPISSLDDVITADLEARAWARAHLELQPNS